MICGTETLARALRQLTLIALAVTVLPVLPCETAFAQGGGYECGFTAPDSTIAGYSKGIPEPHIRDALIRLRVYSLTLKDALPGQSGWSQAEIDSQIARVRIDFAPHHIYFDVVSEERAAVDSAYYYGIPTTEVVENACKLRNYDDAIQIVLATAPSGSSRPSGNSWGDEMDPNSPPTRGIVLVTNSHSTPVMSHEIGHCLGLFHTQQSGGNCGPCTTCQDFVCDTPYDPHEVGDLWQHVDPQTCEYDGTYPNTTPPVDNIMSYSRPVCMVNFTAGQERRMLSCLEYNDYTSAFRVHTGFAYYNKSSETQLTYSGTPYSSITFDYNRDGKKDLFISMRDSYAGSLQKQDQLSPSDVPQFSDRTYSDFASGSEPQAGLRGLAAADYDNDGLVDFFAAAETQAKLYHCNVDSSGYYYSFADSAPALGLGALADSSYAGAWGDYDRDGQVDLFVCRGDGGGNDPAPGNISALRGYLLRNDVRTSGTFADDSGNAGLAATAVCASVAASWADVNGDNAPDLFVGDLRGAGSSPRCRMYINDGAGRFTEEFAARFHVADVDSVNSVAWADMNNDGLLDLVAGGRAHSPLVFFSDEDGHFDGSDPLSSNFSEATNGIRPVDHNLDGRVDLVVLPKDNGKHAWLYSIRVFGTFTELLDESFHAGFEYSTGRVDGMIAADFNHDGDSDLYFGRAVASDKYFYRAMPGATNDAPPTASWAGVRLVAGGGNNTSAIGAKVRFRVGTDFQQLQMVDGGSGRGGQADSTLICGLGGMSGTVSAEVTWPGGYVQTASITRGQVTAITDATAPGVPDSVSGVYTALPEGQAEFTFTWDTPYSCNPSLDKVTITDRPRQPSQCPMGTVVLTPSSGNVTHTVLAKTSAAGGGYRHTLTWPLECRPPCSYNFIIESATDSTHKSAMQQPQEISMPVCISQ